MSTFRVKTDENLARTHVKRLEQAGYDAQSVVEQNLSGVPDAALWRQVDSEDRFFITLDLDFSDVRQFPPGTHPGILLLRPQRASRDAVTRVLERVLQNRSLEQLKGCLAVADESYTRVRRPPGDRK